MENPWITTGTAAQILGYSPGHFRKKFEGLIPCQRIDGGYRRWLRESVERLAQDSKLKPTA